MDLFKLRLSLFLYFVSNILSRQDSGERSSALEPLFYRTLVSKKIQNVSGKGP